MVKPVARAVHSLQLLYDCIILVADDTSVVKPVARTVHSLQLLYDCNILVINNTSEVNPIASRIVHVERNVVVYCRIFNIPHWH